MNNLLPEIKEEHLLISTINDCHFNGIAYPSITEDDFYNENSKLLFKSILKGDNLSINVNALEKILGNSFFDFLEIIPSKVHAFDHILPKLRELRQRREQIKEAQERIKSAIDTSIPLTIKTSVRTLADGLESVDTDARMNRIGIQHGLWRELESITGGLRLGQLFGIVGESESGKTTFAKNWIHHINQTVENIKTACISLEESEEDFVQSICCMGLDISRRELIYKINNDPDFNVKEVYKDYGAWESTSFTYDAYTLNKINSFIEANKPHVCLIDHAQFIQNDSGDGLGSWINTLCNGLKRIAKKHQCAIIILSQIDKSAAKSSQHGNKTVKRVPTLADAWGGIGFKSALDAGFVICRDKDRSMVFCDKCRKPWEIEHRYTKFSMIIDGAKQKVLSVKPITQEIEEETSPWWDK